MSTTESKTSLSVPAAFAAGAVATAVMTVTLALFGMDIMKMLGAMMLGEGSSPAMQYVLGGVVHFMIGTFYAFVFAWVAGLAPSIPRPLLGLVFGAVITPIAIFGMPVMAGMFGGGGAGNPCNPCGGQATRNPCNPCNPCGSSSGAENPCNPCGGQAAGNPCNPCNPCDPSGGAENPCNPCGGQTASNPCNPCTGETASADNPCAGASNPCNPCGGGGASNWISLINHLVYGLFLGLVYKPKGA